MMNQTFDKVASRAAIHSDVLMRSHAAAPAELAPDFDRFGDRLSTRMSSALVAATGSIGVEVRSTGSRTVDSADLGKLLGQLSALSVYNIGQTEHVLMLSLEARALLEQLDRAFGGNGELSDADLPETMPTSADLLAKRVEQQVIGAVTEELGGLQLEAIDRGSNYGRLAPFAYGAEVLVLSFEVSQRTGRPWTIDIVTTKPGLHGLLVRRSGPSTTVATPRVAAALDDPRFADLPLFADARLVDMHIPLGRLKGLAPGMTIPIALARSVPLRIGDVTIAHGTVGEVDDQVALQITQTHFSGKED
ncbi:FliM/FliN family flagellar motor switch protein [Croceibacterium xixiisoli]|nr:FliM/FliN family flagellar motor switch protein [Croceibacterium xixiisoli]